MGGPEKFRGYELEKNHEAGFRPTESPCRRGRNKKNCISLVFRHQGPYEIKFNPKGINNIGHFCQSILVQKCLFREYSAVYSKVLSVHVTTLPK